ncbi:MAG TPA: hypothetical protein VFQ85_10725 [Mycobacteriales bacterium]|jgi:hypothetical protein|nr:hypothetical protein [Mycobacteriales bacterium]
MRPYAAAVLLALTACTGGKAPTAAPSGPASATAAPATTPPIPTKRPTTRPPATPTAAVVRTDLADGRHYAYAKALDTAKRTVVIDVVQFLTGKAAQQAAEEDGQEAFEYYVRNQSTRLRTLSFVPALPVVVNTLTASETGSSSADKTITVAKWASYFAKGEAQQRLYIFTVQGGVVVKVREQYLA